MVINNIEFDHADIFENIEAIIKNFHHVLRTMPRSGKIIYNVDDGNIRKLIKKGIWSKPISFSSHTKKCDWLLEEKDNEFHLYNKSTKKKVISSLIGCHNYKNISLAIIASIQLGISLPNCLKAIKTFKGVKRRMELVGSYRNIKIYDDFAHHPTEIDSSITSIRKIFLIKKY